MGWSIGSSGWSSGWRQLRVIFESLQLTVTYFHETTRPLSRSFCEMDGATWSDDGQVYAVPPYGSQTRPERASSPHFSGRASLPSFVRLDRKTYNPVLRQADPPGHAGPLVERSDAPLRVPVTGSDTLPR